MLEHTSSSFLNKLSAFAMHLHRVKWKNNLCRCEIMWSKAFHPLDILCLRAYPMRQYPWHVHSPLPHIVLLPRQFCVRDTICTNSLLYELGRSVKDCSLYTTWNAPSASSYAWSVLLKISRTGSRFCIWSSHIYVFLQQYETICGWTCTGMVHYIFGVPLQW